MSVDARNLHGIAATLDRLRCEALASSCALVGFVGDATRWTDGHAVVIACDIQDDRTWMARNPTARLS